MCRLFPFLRAAPLAAALLTACDTTGPTAPSKPTSPAIAPTADVSSNNPNSATRVLNCDNGQSVTVRFADGANSNFQVTSSTGVFAVKMLILVFPSGEIITKDTGIQGFDPSSLVTCRYTNPQGIQVTVTGFFTPRG